MSKLHNIRTIIHFGLFGLLILSGCSGGNRLTRVERSGDKGPLLIPAGIDSSIAAHADSLADRLFVSLNRETRSDQYIKLGQAKTSKSDTLWKYLSNDIDDALQVSSEDKAKAVEAFNQGAVRLQELAQLDQSAEDVQTRGRIRRLLVDGQNHFEKAVILNPFDVEARSWLARVYQTLAVRFADEQDNKRSAAVLENLLQMEKGEHALFARLAETYYAMEEWFNAYKNFKTAETVLNATAELDFSADAEMMQRAELDPSTMFYYVYYQGDSQIKLHRAEAGLVDLKRAMEFASTEKEKADIQNYMDWVNWDDGNTKAVEKRDELIALLDKEEHHKAAKGFLQLIPQLKTRRAIDEIVWRLAVLEFQFLERQNEGVDRLKQVVKLTPQDASGAPLDSTYRKYFDSYGVMCHNLGLENMKKNRKFAFMYFQQAAAVDWENRAKSYLEIAKLSRNNAKVAIKSCEGALAHPEQLDSAEQMQLYQLLVEGYKRSGRFNDARKYYAQWMQMRQQNRRASR